MPLHNEIIINCKKCATTENQGTGVKFEKFKFGVSSLAWVEAMEGCMFHDCVLVIRLDMTTPPWWRENVVIVVVYHYHDFLAINSL